MSVSLAECKKVQAVDFLGRLFISADGDKPTPCYVVKIVASPILIFPPQYEVQWEQPKPCVDLSAPYHVVGGPFELPAGEKVVRVSYRRDGKPVTDEIPIKIVRGADSREALASGGGGGFPGPFAAGVKGPAGDSAMGFSGSFSFEEAFRNAIGNLPKRQPAHPDELVRVVVTNIGAEFGGFIGFNHLFVQVHRTVA